MVKCTLVLMKDCTYWYVCHLYLEVCAYLVRGHSDFNYFFLI